MSDCRKPEPPKPVSSCCEADQSKVSRPDYLLWISASIIFLCYGTYLVTAGLPELLPQLPIWLTIMSSGVYELINSMWWGLLMAVIFVGLLERIPRNLVMSALGQGGTFKGIVRATVAGVLLDLCSHGILMVGAKLYERGASLGQLMAFLIASPWNSLSLTIILVALIGWGWTLTFVGLSMLVGIVSGFIFDRLVAAKSLTANPNSAAQENSLPIIPQLTNLVKGADYSVAAMIFLIRDGLRGSKMVFRWLFFGLVVATAIRAFVPLDTYQALFGPTLTGLFATLLAATIIEVCSEGSTPIAADILTRAAAPGNGFVFLMAGVATDYTEVMVVRDTTKSWKIALFIPLLTLPQILLIGWLLNQL